MPPRALLIALICSVPVLAQETKSLLDDGRTAYRKGDISGAELKLAAAWLESEKGGPNDPLRYQILKLQAVVASAGKKYVEAEGFLQLAVNWRERANGINDPGIADELSEIALTVARAGDGDRAITILTRVQSMRIRPPGSPGSHEVANDYSRMAQVYQMMNSPQMAATALEQALAMREKLLGLEHSGLLPELDRLATTRIVLTEYEKAETLYRRALAIREIASGAESPDLIQTLDGLAYSLFGQRRFDEAEPVYQRLLALWVSSASAMHPMVAATLDKLAVFYRAQEKWAEGKDASERANAVRTHGLAAALAREAGFLVSRKEFATAAGMYKQALLLLSGNRPEYAELREETTKVLKELEATQPAKKAAGSRRSSSPGK